MKNFAEEELSPLFGGAKFETDFTTDDGTVWYAVRFQIKSGTFFKLTFPKDEDRKHKDGTFSSQHVALYAFSDGDLTDSEVMAAAQMIVGYFNTARF